MIRNWLEAARLLAGSQNLRLRAGQFGAVNTPKGWVLFGVDFDSGQPVTMFEGVPATEVAAAVRQCNGLEA